MVRARMYLVVSNFITWLKDSEGKKYVERMQYTFLLFFYFMHSQKIYLLKCGLVCLYFLVIHCAYTSKIHVYFIHSLSS